VDFLGPSDSVKKDYKHIIAVVDSFTKFCWLYPSKSQSCVTKVQYLAILPSSSPIEGLHLLDFLKYCDEEKPIKDFHA